MMGIMSSAILGPFANYFVPIMLGARRMAFPRHRGAHVLAADGRRRDPDDDHLLRRLPDRMDGLRAAARRGERAASTAYIVFFALVGLSMCAARAEHGRDA